MRGVRDLLQVIKQDKEQEVLQMMKRSEVNEMAFTQRLNEIKQKQTVIDMKLQELNGGAINGIHSNSR
ncbi:UNVERIFIED_ORG: hypothetical protein J2X74_003830 [Bacillus sp. 1751]|nr:hypothetical protein [Bacillus sp. 1751]